jgi:CheY-like chemotaxis protein
MQTVLVVDDDSSVRNVMSQILENLGYDVVTASHGLEAVTLFQAERCRIDLVMTDLRMPVMDGYEAVALLRAANPSVRIVCMSSYLAESCPAGAFFLEKPFTVQSVRDCVRKALSDKPAAQAE